MNAEQLIVQLSRYKQHALAEVTAALMLLSIPSF